MRLKEITISANTGLDAIKRAPIVDEYTGLKCLRIQDISQKKEYDDWGNTQTTENDYKKFKLRIDDILVARTGATVGVSYLVRKNLNAVFNNGSIRLRLSDKADTHFVYYVFQTKSFNQYIDNVSCVATQPNLRVETLLKFNIPDYNINIQRRIASVLSAYDNLIENNNRRIRLLEQMAENLYKEWFVRFRFPGHEKYSFTNGIPSDSQICQLKDFVIRRNKVLKRWENLSLIDLSRMKPYEIHILDIGEAEELTSNVKQVCKYDLLFGSIRSYQGKCGFSPIDGAIAGSVYNFYPIQEYMFCFLLLLITSKPFIDYTVNYSNGTKMPVLNYTDLVRFKFPILKDKTIYQKFNDIVLPMITQINNLIHMNWLLKKQRDLLLPRLMSGKLEVNA